VFITNFLTFRAMASLDWWQGGDNFGSQAARNCGHV